VKTLLQTYLDSEEWDLSAFVDLILGQTTVGTVVKIEDDEDEGIFALVTALNLYRYRVACFLLCIKLAFSYASNLLSMLWDLCSMDNDMNTDTT